MPMKQGSAAQAAAAWFWVYLGRQSSRTEVDGKAWRQRYFWRGIPFGRSGLPD